jgi:hypothetical protein
MWKDPVVEEIREARHKILERFGGDLTKYAEHLRQEQAKHPERYVSNEGLDAQRTNTSEPELTSKP